MKKFVRNTIGAFMALSLVAGAISCSDGLDESDPFVEAGVVNKPTNSSSSGSGSSGNGGSGSGVAATGSFDMPENEWDKGNLQYKGSTGIASLDVGDKVTMTFKGKASRAFKGEFFIVDTTPTAGLTGYWGELAEKYVLDVPAEFNITHTFEITQKPWGTGDESTYFAVVGKGETETIHIDYTELKFVKNGEEGSGEQGGESGSGQEQGGEGAGQTITPVTYSAVRKAYTVKLTKDIADASIIGYVLQIDNDGTKDADGLKIDISNLKLSVKVGNGDAVEKDFAEFNIVPNQWATPAYGKTDARKRLGLTGTLTQGTEITVQVLSATVSNSTKAPSIIFALQEDGDSYGMLGTESGDSQDIWLPAFADASATPAPGGDSESAAETESTEPAPQTDPEETPAADPETPASDPETPVVVTKPEGTVKEVTTVNNEYSTSNHGIQAKVAVRPDDKLNGLAVGDKITVVMKGVSTKDFTPQFYFMDNTAAGGYSNLWDWGDSAELKTTGFEVTKEITLKKAPTSDEADAFVFVIDYDEDGATADLENATIYFTEFSVTKEVAENQTVVDPAPAAADTTIWTGEAELDWAKGDASGDVINKDKFAGKTFVGLKFTISSFVQDATTIRIMAQDDWSDITPFESAEGDCMIANSGDAEGKALWVWGTSATVKFSASNIERITNNGIKFYGTGVTITKVELVTE